MSLRLALLSLIVLLPTGAVAQTKPAAGSTHAKAAGKAATHSQAPELKGHTPAARVLVPWLKTRLTAVPGAESAEPKTARPAAAASAVQPNFGGYLAAPYYPARLEPSCVTDPYNCGVTIEMTADFDKDGKPDIAVLQNDGILNVLLNNGSGGFAAPVSYLNPNFSSTFIQQGFAVDVNNDGYADILAYDEGNNAIIVYLNQKNGTFAAPLSVPLSSNYGSIASIAIGDVNGDGKVDVVTIAPNVTGRASTDITVQSYLGNGSGGFATPGAALTQTFTVAAQVQVPGSLGITLGDLNNDGKLDIAADLEEQTSQNTGVVVATIAIGNGDGSFGALNVTNIASVPVAAPPGIPFLNFGTSGIQIVDLNNDKNNDIAMDANGTLYVALGTGSGTFGTPVQTANYGLPVEDVYYDVNGDGIPDVVQDNGVLNVWIGKGDGTFTLPINGNTYIEDGGDAQSLAIADFNGDGNADIAQLGLDYKQVSLFLGNGKGVFQGAPALSSTTDTFQAPDELVLEAAGDIVGNGFTDAVFVDQTQTAPYVVSALSDGKGGFKYVTALTAAVVPNLGFLEPVQADFNGDGKQDLLMAGSDASLSVALSNGDGTFKTPVSLGLPALDCYLNYAATGDLNGDGHTDIVVTYPGDASCGGTGSVPSGYFVALGKGDGTFAAPVFTASGNELYTAALGDMNMDGNLDLILTDDPFDGSGNFSVSLLPGNGDGTFSTGTAVLSDDTVSQVIVGDYNQDGKPDLILFSEGPASIAGAGNVEDASIVLLPGNGDGTFGDSNQLATGNFFLNGALADVNNDGIPDIVGALYYTHDQPNTYYGLSTLLGTGGGAFAAPVNALEGLASELRIVGNFTGDNAPGVLVASSYGTALFLGQGGSAIGLTSSAASLVFGQVETLTATLTPTFTTRPAPTGWIAFYDGTTLLGTSAVSGSAATYTAGSLAVGSHSFTAVYTGDGNFNPNTSAASAVTVTTLAPAFTLTADPGSVSVPVGQQGVATLTLAANATFTGNIALTCSGMPANATCTVNPTQVTLAGNGSATATVVVGTTTTASNHNQPVSPFSKYAGGLTLAGLLCCFVRRKFARGIFPMLVLLTLGFAAAALSGCGNGNGINTAAKGNYTVTVTATPSGSGATAQTATLSVTLQ